MPRRGGPRAAQAWQAREKSTTTGTLTNLGSSPSITVYAADGTGTLTIPTTTVSAGSTGTTITFTYTAPTGGLSKRLHRLVVPSGWSAPSTAGMDPGYTTSSTGTVAVFGQTITVSGVTLTGGGTFTIVYGSTASSGPGATATSTTGAQTWQAQETSVSGGSLTNLAASPSITVYAADGSGTLTTHCDQRVFALNRQHHHFYLYRGDRRHLQRHRHGGGACGLDAAGDDKCDRLLDCIGRNRFHQRSADHGIGSEPVWRGSVHHHIRGELGWVM